MPDILGLAPTPAVAPVPVAASIGPHSDGVTVLSGDQASQGIKLGHMRYVLGIGLALAVAAGLILAIFFSH
jgi:hypothetical protein